MQVSLVNPPKIFARNASGRMVQIAGHPGEVGRFINIVVPDEREIRRLRPVLAYLEKLKATPFDYGTASRQRLRSRPVTLSTSSSDFNRIDNLPLFKKL